MRQVFRRSPVRSSGPEYSLLETGHEIISKAILSHRADSSMVVASYRKDEDFVLVNRLEQCGLVH